jgi:oxygen-independent coproporphyrinogen-3 oxidase
LIDIKLPIAAVSHNSVMQRPVFDPALIARYDRSGPRYTSYPTAVQFHPGFGEEMYRAQVVASNRDAAPLSLYLHIPFCARLCFYCGCNKVVTKNRTRAAPYLANLHREIELQGRLFDPARPVTQLHWGGGTPTFISLAEMRELLEVTQRHFRLLNDDSGEYGIEVDPREIQLGTLALLREHGFNRLSLGVQDFEPRVQAAVNRIQSEAQTFSVLHEARDLGFRSINMDLIYGLPLQTVESFTRTLDKVIAVQPDRLSVFNYAHLPQMFTPQKRINAEDLPSPQQKLAILQASIERLTDAGYVYIGMDHFARPDDELAIAQENGTLYRNFQGYSTHADCDLVGLGITAIGSVGASYSQNVKTLEEYAARLDADRLPVFRGVALDADDLLRRDVITQLICHFTLDIPALERAHGIVFADYFDTELAELAQMRDDGLIALATDRIDVQPAGKLLVRNICMVFDRYLRAAAPARYSRVI